MREIKFRAWDKDEKKMHYDYIGGFNPNSIGKECFIGCEGYINGELMQFTGLKDKNGKEVYEGDIVKCEREWNKGLYYNIVYDKWGFCLKRRRYLTFIDPENLEIIGNIYENPELVR